MDAEILGALLKVVQDKDTATAAHTWRVALYSLALAEAAEVPRDKHWRLMRAAVLHDIGKLDVPPDIVSKPGRLTPEEYEQVKAHTWLGHERLLKMGESDEIVLQVVRSHHERLDGSGYPDGLTGEEIPLPARHFAVIDSFDAMTSLRPYRSGVGEQAADLAIEELRRHANKWYCAETVELFARLYESGELDWILHHLNDDESLIEHPPAPDDADLADAQQRIRETLEQRRRVEPPEIESVRRGEKSKSRKVEKSK